MDTFCPVCDRGPDSWSNTMLMMIGIKVAEHNDQHETNFKITCAECGTSYEWERGSNQIHITPKDNANEK